jgi:hypothetical protein
MSNKKEKTIPAATIRGTYSTFESRKQRDYVKELGHVVDFTVEKMIRVEIGAWGNSVNVLTVGKNVTVSVMAQPDGTTKVIFRR